MGGFIGRRTPKPDAVDCLAKDASGVIWHFWVFPEDVITDPIPKFVKLGSSTTSYSVGDEFYKSKRKFTIWDKQRVEDYNARLGWRRISEEKEAREEEEFQKYINTAQFFVNLAGLFVPLLGGVTVAYRLWLVKTAIEALKVCVKAEAGGMSGGDMLESLQNVFLEEWLFKEYKAICPGGLRSAIELTEKGYKIYEPYDKVKNVVEVAKAYGQVKRRWPTSVDSELIRIHRFRYIMDPAYASLYDQTDKMFQQWRKR